MILDLFGISNRAIRLKRLKTTLYQGLMYAAGYITLHEDIQSSDDLVDAIQKISVLILDDFTAYLTFDELEPPVACIITPDFTLRPTPTSNDYKAWFSLDEAGDTFPSILMGFASLCGKMAARRDLSSTRLAAPETLKNKALEKDVRGIVEELATYIVYTHG